MKFLAGLLSVIGLALCLCGSAVASQTHSAPAAKKAAPQAIKVAPADEYFGRLKMSILGIRNTLKDLAQKADYNPANPEQIFGSAAYAEEALHEWEHKYPADPWLAKSIAGLVHMYSRVPTQAGREKMHAALSWLQSRYGHKTRSIVESAKAEAEEADKAIVEPAAAATLAPAAQNAPAPVASNAPAPPNP